MTGGIRVEPARVDWLEALAESDDSFTARFGIPVVEGWAGFPEAVPHALDGTRKDPDSPWGTHLFFDGDGALVGFGGWKGAPTDGVAELGYAVAPSRQGRGIATAVVDELVARGRAAALATVIAHTLGEESASTAVLRKTGFTMTDAIDDPDDGPIWRWELRLAEDDSPERRIPNVTRGHRRHGWILSGPWRTSPSTRHPRSRRRTRRASPSWRSSTDLWLLPSSWDRWRTMFEEAGYATIAPGWPDDPNTVEEANLHPEVFAHKTVGEIADHYDDVLQTLSAKPAIIGHSFGGLLTQILAGRGLSPGLRRHRSGAVPWRAARCRSRR